jgi:hypothetical protein
VFTWSAFWTYFGNHLPLVLYCMAALLLGLLVGLKLERSKWQVYLKAYHNQISNDRVASLKADVLKLRNQNAVLQEKFTFQQSIIKGAHLQASKVLEVLASLPNRQKVDEE